MNKISLVSCVLFALFFVVAAWVASHASAQDVGSRDTKLSIINPDGQSRLRRAAVDPRMEILPSILIDSLGFEKARQELIAAAIDSTYIAYDGNYRLCQLYLGCGVRDGVEHDCIRMWDLSACGTNANTSYSYKLRPGTKIIGLDMVRAGILIYEQSEGRSTRLNKEGMTYLLPWSGGVPESGILTDSFLLQP